MGGDPSERLIYLVARGGAVLGLDLESGTTLPLSQALTTPAVGPDGSMLGASRDAHLVRLVARRTETFRPTLPASPRWIFGTQGGQAVVITGGDSVRMLLIGSDRVTHSTLLPDTLMAAAPWGDLVAVRSGQGVSLFDPEGRQSETSVSLDTTPTALTFSASGHRLYVATSESRIRVFDRFGQTELPSIPLPGPATALRFDFSGRWLLGRPTSGDSVWIVDAATARLATTVATAWDADLPQVVGASTLLMRGTDNDVMAVDLASTPLAVTGRVDKAAGDLWLIIQWVPRGERSRALAAAESALVAQDSALVTPADLPVAPLGTSRVFLQISSSQNPDWAEALARQVAGLGFPASVAQPERPDEGFRVIVGPYGSREEAEEAGRRLGRPYFILTRAR